MAWHSLSRIAVGNNSRIVACCERAGRTTTGRNTRPDLPSTQILIQSSDAGAMLRQFLEGRLLAEPFSQRFSRHSAPAFACRNVSHEPGGCGKLSALADAQMASDGAMAPHRNVVLQHRRARDPDLRSNHAMPPDPEVVRNLNEVSIFVPSPMTVSPTLPRSIVLLAPISTSLPIVTRPSCGTFTCPDALIAKPKPSWPVRAPA